MVVSRRRLLIVAVASSVGLGALAALLSWSGVAMALFGVAGLAAFAWIVLWAQAVNATLLALGRKIDAVDAKVKKLPRQARIVELNRLLSNVRVIARHTEVLAREVQISVHRLPSETVELSRLYDEVVEHDRPMPELGNWAMTPATLIWIMDRIRNPSVRTIVECGSGSSTIWFASALEHRGGAGRVVALESSAEWAEITRSRAADMGLSHRVEVVYGPLVETALPGVDPQPWYDLSGLPVDVTTIDLLFVDGPLGSTASQARYPGFPMLADRLPKGAIVVLDDTVRSDEQQILKRWLAERPAGRRLTVADRLDRSVTLTVDIEV